MFFYYKKTFFIITSVLTSTILHSIKKEFIDENLEMKTISNILNACNTINYQKIHASEIYKYHRLPFNDWGYNLLYDGIRSETFIATFLNAQVCSNGGIVKQDNFIIKESLPFFTCDNFHMFYITQMPFNNIKKINGRVAIISAYADITYGHWLFNILSRLALLEMNHIEYDWLFVSQAKKYMKETLSLWGIDCSKVIEPSVLWQLSQNCCIFNPKGFCLQADEIILPSHFGMVDFNNPSGFVGIAHYRQDIIKYIRDKFLSLLNKNKNYNFSKKIFISREDSNLRLVSNENEVFALFEKEGFVKYNLSNLSYLEQVALFHQAEFVAGFQGSGLLNILYCNQNVTIIEIFSKFLCPDLYKLSQELNLKNYIPIKTTDFDFSNLDLSNSVKIDTQNIELEIKKLFKK